MARFINILNNQTSLTVSAAPPAEDSDGVATVGKGVEAVCRGADLDLHDKA